MSLRAAEGSVGAEGWASFIQCCVFVTQAGCGAQSRAVSHKQQTCTSWVTHGSALTARFLLMKGSILCMCGISETVRKPTVEKGSSSLFRVRLFISPADVEGAPAGLLDCGHRCAVSLSRRGEDAGSADLPGFLFFYNYFTYPFYKSLFSSTRAHSGGFFCESNYPSLSDDCWEWSTGSQSFLRRPPLEIKKGWLWNNSAPSLLSNSWDLYFTMPWRGSNYIKMMTVSIGSYRLLYTVTLFLTNNCASIGVRFITAIVGDTGRFSQCCCRVPPGTFLKHYIIWLKDTHDRAYQNPFHWNYHFYCIL